MSTQDHMSNKTPKTLSEVRTTVTLNSAAHKRASIAAAVVGENLLEFLNKAADDRTMPILKRHGIKLPSDCELSTT